MKHKLTWVCVLFIVGISQHIHTSVPTANAAEKQPLPAQTIGQSIEQTGTLLVNMATQSGKFRYRFHLNPSQIQSPNYNILRHAGAIYALGQLNQISASKKTVSVIQNATRFMMDTSFMNVPAYPNAATIWSLPEVHGKNKPPVAKLGGAGLALVALFTAAHTEKDFQYKNEMRAIGNFILRMQKEDGSFYSKFLWNTQRPDNSWNSLYYPGEAALGLLCLYEMTHEAHWAQAANRSLLALAEQRANATTVPADHWALIATQSLFTNYSSLRPHDKEIHLRHIRQIVTEILESQIGTPRANEVPPKISPLTYGAFDAYGKTTPAATRMEGLLAAYHCLPSEDRVLKERIRNSIEAGIKFLVRAQVQTPPHIGAIPRAVLAMKEVSKEAKQFNKRTGEVRIDYLQHTLSALAGYLKLLKN